jgi:hypothetical protein
MASNVYGNLHKTATTMLEGDFNCVLVEVKPTKNSKNNSMFKCKWRVEDGPHQGHTFYQNINVTPENPVAMRIFFGHMDILGANALFFQSLAGDLTIEQSDDEICRKIDGARAVLEIGVREWQGRKSEDVKNLKRPGAMTGGVASPMGSAGPVQATQLPTASPAATPTSPSPSLPPSPVAPVNSPPPTPY